MEQREKIRSFQGAVKSEMVLHKVGVGDKAVHFPRGVPARAIAWFALFEGVFFLLGLVPGVSVLLPTYLRLAFLPVLATAVFTYGRPEGRRVHVVARGAVRRRRYRVAGYRRPEGQSWKAPRVRERRTVGPGRVLAVVAPLVVVGAVAVLVLEAGATSATSARRAAGSVALIPLAPPVLPVPVRTAPAAVRLRDASRPPRAVRRRRAGVTPHRVVVHRTRPQVARSAPVATAPAVTTSAPIPSAPVVAAPVVSAPAPRPVAPAVKKCNLGELGC